MDSTRRWSTVLWLGTVLGACGDDAVAPGDTETDTGTTGSSSLTSASTSPTTASTSSPSTSDTGTTMATDDSTSTTTGSTSTGATETTTGSTSTGTTETTGTTGTTESGTSTSTTETTAETTGTSGTSSSSSSSSSESGAEEVVPGFAGMSLDDEYVVFDLVTEMVASGPSSLLPEADYPYDATIRPDGAEVWFVGAAGDGFVVVDTSSFAILEQATLATGQYAVDVLFSADSTTAYIANRDTSDLTILDAMDYSEIGSTTTPGAVDAGKMALNPCTGQIYVVEWYGDLLMTYDPEADSWDSVDIGVASLWDLAVDPSGSTIYVTDRGNDQVHVFDVSATDGLPNAVPDASVDVGDDPWGIDITSDGDTVVVACEDDSSVHFIDTAALGTTSLALANDADPRDVDISGDDAVAYIPSGDIAGDDAMFVVDLATQSLVGTITLGGAGNTNVVAVAPQAVTCL